MAKLNTLTDNFGTASANWDGYDGTNVAVSGGQLSIVPDTTFTRMIKSAVSWDAADSECAIEVTSLGSSEIFALQLGDISDSHQFLVMYFFDQLVLREQVDGVASDTAITYSTDHRWWRIQVAGGSVNWQTSPNGTSWTTQRSKAWAIPQVTELYPSVLAYSSDSSTPATADNFNLLPSAPAGQGSLWWMSTLGGAVSSPPGGDGGDDGGPYTQAFYVSPNGNDSNSGMSAVAPWRTIARAHQRTYTAGEALLLERGQTHYGAITIVPNPSGSAKFTIGAYGSGAKPVLSSYKVLDNASAWTNLGGNIWRIDLTNPATHSGFTTPGNGVFVRGYNVGHFRVGSATYGWLRDDTSELSQQWDWVEGEPFTYVYSAGNPTTVAASSGGLMAAPEVHSIQTYSNTEIRDLEIVGAGAHGVNTIGSGTVSNIHLHNCDIHHIGGSVLLGFSYRVRFGNGISLWTTTSNMLSENCTSYECFDSPWTLQGSGGHSQNVVARNNTFYDSSQIVELFAIESAQISTCVFENNYCYGAGGGWSGPTQPNQGRRCHVAIYPPYPLPLGFIVRNNTFIGLSGPQPEASYFMCVDYPVPGLQMYGNDIRLPAGMKISLATGHLISQGAAYQAASGLEAGSTFTVL